MGVDKRQVIRVFPRRTGWTPVDSLAFVGDPPALNLPPQQPVAVSVTFSWDVAEGERLVRAWSVYYPDVQIGGPAFGDPGGEFVPGRFLRPGVVITSRGCIRRCRYCQVPGREGRIREYTIHEGHIIQDNNLLACSRGHIEAVFDMLRRQTKLVKFSGGLDARLLTPWHCELLAGIKIDELWFACDTRGQIWHLKRIAPLVARWPIDKRRCYVMIGHNNETRQEAEWRLQRVYSLGFLPFSQLYRGPDERQYDAGWRALNRRWSRPGFYRSKMPGRGLPNQELEFSPTD